MEAIVKTKNNKKRDVRLDIVRIFSLFSVIAVHFFLNSGFYEKDVIGKSMLISSIIRSFFIICVPMFITLTGYLMNRKEISKKYYKGIVKTLVIYLFCSVLYSFFIKYYLKGEMNIGIFLKNILSFSGTKYSWYIEMYIGLFLIIPFLNLIFNNLKNQKQAQLLLITLILLIGLPASINIFKFDSLEWWMQPRVNSEYFRIIPQWWMGIYPIFYYFLGAYLRKYEIKIRTKLNVILLIILVILDGVFNFYRSYNSQYIWGTWNSYYSAIVMLITFLTFNLFLKIKIKESKIILEKILKIISDACLGAYLISCCFDIFFYEKLAQMVPEYKDKILYAPLMVLIVFICSIATSILLNYIYNLANGIIKQFKKKCFIE